MPLPDLRPGGFHELVDLLGRDPSFAKVRRGGPLPAAELVIEPRGKASYALRRRMTFRDRAELNRLVEQPRPGGHRLAALIEAIAGGDLFAAR